MVEVCSNLGNKTTWGKALGKIMVVVKNNVDVLGFKPQSPASKSDTQALTNHDNINKVF